MKTQRRLVVLLALLVLLFVGALVLLRWLDSVRTARLYRDVAAERAVAFDALLELKGAPLRTLVSDYTFWDEMVRFVRSGDRRWAAENVDTALDTFGADVIWIYRPDTSLRYGVIREGASAPAQLPLPAAAWSRLFGGGAFAHFFVDTSRGVIEVRGATIHPTSDRQRQTPRRGYLFAGRRWTTGYLRELGALMDGSVIVFPPGARATGGDRRSGSVTVARALNGWDGRAVGRVEYRTSSRAIGELTRSADRQFLLLIIFSATVLVLPAILIGRWIYAPLQRISASLSAKDPSALGKLPQDRGEFGDMAQAVLRFFEQSELIQEITERRRAVAVLRDTEARFQDLFENASDLVFTYDLGGQILSLNRAGEDLTGYRRDDIMAMGIDTLLSPESRPRIREEVQRLLEGTAASRIELEIVTRDGRLVPVEVVAGLLRSGGKPVGVQGIARDITERRAVEEERRRQKAELEERVAERTALLAEREGELREAKSFLEHLIAGSPSVIFRIDPAAEDVTYVSPNVHRFLGYRPSDILRHPGFWTDHVHPDDRGAFRAALERAIAERASQFEVEYRFRHQGGEYRWLTGLARLEYDAAGRPVSLFGYALDVTERKVAEEDVQRAKVEAERANLAKSEFLSRMSHELRTPLNAILGFAQLLEMDALSGEQSESVNHILRGGKHLLELINEVLDISRIEAGRLALSPEAVSVAQVLGETLALISPLAAQGAVQILGDALTTEAHVLADLQRLKQVLLNLLSNAVKYNRRGGSIVVSVLPVPGARLRITVKDTGRGIPADKMDQLFVPFARLGAEQSGVEGTGMGLALSRGLVEAMGGEMGVESVAGTGSTFWVELPQAESPVGAAERMWAELPPTPADETPADGPRTVLYVEDNLTNLDLLQRVLGERPQIKLLAAMQGRLGLELARQHRPDLIFLDVHLPDLSGEEVLRRLLADPETRSIPVVIISADATSGQAERLIAVGAHGFVHKPIDVRQLMRTLDESLRAADVSRRAGRPS